MWGNMPGSGTPARRWRQKWDGPGVYYAVAPEIFRAAGGLTSY